MPKRPRDGETWSVQQYLDYLYDYTEYFYNGKSDIFWLDQVIGLEQAQIGYQMLGSTLDFSSLVPEMIPGNIQQGTELYMFRATPTDMANIPLYLACFPATDGAYSDKIWDLWVNGTMHLDYDTGLITFSESTKVLTMELDTSGTPSGTITWDPDFVAAHEDKKYTFTEFTTYPELQTFASVSKNYTSALLNAIGLTSGNDRLGVDCEFLHGQLGAITDSLGFKSDVYETVIDGNSTVVDCEWLYNNSSSGGTTDYNELSNKPQINENTLQGNMVLDSGDIPDDAAGDVTISDVLRGLESQITALQGQVGTLQGQITALQATQPRVITEEQINTIYTELPEDVVVGSVALSTYTFNWGINYGRGTNINDHTYVFCLINPWATLPINKYNPVALFQGVGTDALPILVASPMSDAITNKFVTLGYVGMDLEAAQTARYAWVRIVISVPYLATTLLDYFIDEVFDDIHAVETRATNLETRATQLEARATALETRVPELPDDVDENLPYVLTSENETE